MFKSPSQKPWLYITAVLLALLAGALDVFFEFASDVPILYLLPVILVAWFSGGISIALVSIFCALTWFTADVISERIHAHSAISLWYFAVVLVLFLTLGYFMSYIRKILSG
jgi:hypothetical protein